MATTKWSAPDLAPRTREVVVGAEHGHTGHVVAARERAVEHTDRGVDAAGDDGVDHLPALVRPADHDEAVTTGSRGTAPSSRDRAR